MSGYQYCSRYVFRVKMFTDKHTTVPKYTEGGGGGRGGDSILIKIFRIEVSF